MSLVHRTFFHAVACAIAVSAFPITAAAQEANQPNQASPTSPTSRVDSPQPPGAAHGDAIAAIQSPRAADATNSTNETAAPAEAMEPVQDTHRGDVQRTVGWTLCGAGGAAVAIGGVLAIVAKGEYDEAASQTGAARDATSRDADRAATSAALGIAAGAAAVLSGTIVLLTAPSAHVSVATNGRELLLRGTF
jgi:hypothetical protein